jgi:hypothetical protein
LSLAYLSPLIWFDVLFTLKLSHDDA